MANRNFASKGNLFSMHASPVMVDCNFKVAAADTAGLGITNLKGPLVSAVYMHSSAATPSAINPAAGTIVVRLQDNFNTLLDMDFAVLTQPNSGSDVKIDNSAMTAGVAYTITTLGNATRAKFTAIGVPPGVTPAVGVSFIALTNGGAGNTLTTRVQATATAGSGMCSIEIVGNPQLSIAPNPTANQGYGAQIILQCRDYAGAIVQPADDTVIDIKLILNNSSITVQGD